MHDPDLRDATITVTSVDVSPDLRNAIAFVMPLGGKDTDRCSLPCGARRRGSAPG